MTILPTEYKNEFDAVSRQFSVELRGVGKKYHLAKFNHEKHVEPVFWALRDINFSVEEGQIVGIIGRNGAGKTTLLNIISGALTASEGRVFVKSKVLGLFSLGIGFQDELSGKDNIFLNGTLLGATRKELEVKLPEIIDFSELGDFINMPLGAYSQGMRLRLGFSVIASLDFNILAVDEVLAVGDSLFQDKCFKRLADFKRSGKTLIITVQNMDLIERLCDKIVFLNHGKMEFCGDVPEGINRYRAALNTEKFFIGSAKENPLVENTKKWADDTAGWQRKLGTKEIIIEKVEFLSGFNRRCSEIKSGGSLTIKANFTARNKIKQLHFGVAIFRNDGVYCYGSNTALDGHDIPEIKPGTGNFMLIYEKILLAPGEYRLSVAIWDKNETQPFDYHDGCYKLIITGNKNYNDLLSIPYRFVNTGHNQCFNLFSKMKKTILNLPELNNEFGHVPEGEGEKIVSLKLVDRFDKVKDTFETNEIVSCAVVFGDSVRRNKNYYLWLAFYRDDEVCCQNIIYNIGKSSSLRILFDSLALLPGGYRISYGIWDDYSRKFVMRYRGIHKFRMVSWGQDHGTVFLKHNWRYKLPK